MARKQFVTPGQRFGRITVIRETQVSRAGRTYRAAVCACDCGNEITSLLGNLCRGAADVKSCGCLARERTSERVSGARKQFVTPGQRFGRLTVIREVRVTSAAGKKGWAAVCACDCGTETTVRFGNLFTGKPSTRSCGCLCRETVPNYRHGLTHHELYVTWRGMMARCENPGATRYRNYGGRGIKVCDRWRDSANFITDIEAAIGPRPDGMTLDRIDNDGNYEPGNVRWATSAEQQANTRPRRSQQVPGSRETVTGPAISAGQ